MKPSRRTRLIALLLAAALALVAAPALAGGWAVATLDQIPAGVVAGEPFAVTFRMRQHGIRLVDWGPMPLTFRHAEAHQVVTVTALAGGEEGQYAVDVTLPTSGVWEWTIGEGLIQPMPSLTVAKGPKASPVRAPAPGLALTTLIGLAGLAGVGVGLLALIRTHKPWATGLTISAALVAALGFTLPPTASSPARQPAPTTSHGQDLFLAKGCVMCHAHSAVAEVRARTIGDFNSFSTGPNLSDFHASPDYLRKWLDNPASVKPETQMPDLGLSEAEIEALIVFLNARP